MMEMGESIRSAIFVAEETPPVPPRRKKRKSKAMPIAGPSRTVHYKKRLPPPPPPLPPPPPPPPLPHLRKSKFRSCTSPIIIQKENRHAQAQVGEAEKSPREKNYPSLFFTISDFENVMRDSLSGGKKLLDTSVYSGENELTTSFIENPTIEEDAFFSSSPTIDGKERNFVEEEQSVSPLESTFDEENEVCFRVTTTNLPFEKCLKRWDFDNRRSSYEEDRSNDFIFQDYMDRSNKANIIKSKLNFSSENFNSIEESKPHSPTRVRFVIESPSTSASEYKSLVDSNEAYRELQNVESLLNESEENCEESEEKTTDFDKFSDFALDLKATSEFVLTESSMILSNFTNTSEIDDDSKDKDLAKLVEEAQTHEGLGDSTEKDYNVNERRNSFLETMLSDDQRGTCEIIAARLKIVKIPEERSVDDSRSIAEKNVEAKRNLADKKVEAKSVGEAKSDVLDELLKNFNTIKLKPVGHVVPEEKKMATPASVDGGGLAEEAFRISIDNKEDNDEIVRTTCVNSTDNETDSRYDENRVNYQHAICSGVQLSENELESGAGTKDKNRNDGEDVVESLAISLKSSKQDEREKGEISEKWDDAEDAVSAGGKVEGDRCEDEEIAEVLAMKLDKPLHWDWELTTSADALPIIQLLNKDGKVLVETTGKTAQRARGSFRNGLRTLEKFPSEDPGPSSCSSDIHSPISSSPVPRVLGNRNFEGFSTKFGGCHFAYSAKKSKSDVSIDARAERRGRKRHSTGVEAERGLRRSETAPKRYSAGDFLRRQILEDLRDPSDADKSPEQLALLRYNKVKAYLDENSTSPHRSPSRNNNEAIRTELTKLARIRSILERRKWPAESFRSPKDEPPCDYRPRKIRSETNIGTIEEERRRKFKERPPSFIQTNNESFPLKRSDYRPRKIRSETNVGSVEDSSRRKLKERAASFRKDSDGACEFTEKRKFYRKTKSDVLLGQIGTSEELGSSPRRINQDNVQRSWRDYKERKKHEKLNREKLKEYFMNDQNNPNCSYPESRPSTALQENYLLLEKCGTFQPMIVARVQVNGAQEIQNLSQDFGYNSIKGDSFEDYKDLYSRSNVRKSNTFKIVDGSEKGGRGNQNGQTRAKENLKKGWLSDKSNEDIAKDYFRRVYELLKEKQREASEMSQGQLPAGYEDSSSSNYSEEMQRNKYRRRRENTPEGAVKVSSTLLDLCNNAGQEDWSSQRLLKGKEEEGGSLTSGEEKSSNYRRGFCPDAPVGFEGKRSRVAPPIPTNGKVIEDHSEKNKKNCSEDAIKPGIQDEEEGEEEEEEGNMGSNLSRHNGKGLTGRRTQSSGDLCEPKGKLNVGKILAPCSNNRASRYKFCGSLPNHLDDKDSLEQDPGENNNVTPDAITEDLCGAYSHKKRSLGVHFSDGGPTGNLDLVKHGSQDSFDENDPWRYQQSDLDLVRCRHGNFDAVRRNRSADTVADTKKYVRATSLNDKCGRSSNLDLVDTLPKRKTSIRDIEKTFERITQSQPTMNVLETDDSVLRMMHKPDCELVKHRQLNKCVDLKLSKITGEPQDQGYASERSPEDEHPPSLPGRPFPAVTPESTFRVTLQKSSRGLGLSVSGGGTAGPVRVKRLFPQQPAALSNKLQPGDILLAANGVPLTGLNNYEALEVLRTSASTVELVVCRLPGDKNVSPPGTPPPPPARRETQAPRILSPLPPLQIEPCGEFDIEMVKVGGSLGFTLRKADSSALGHYVRALVREPALSDGRIRPGDKIVAVDGAPLSPMSHEEAVALLRQCGPKVKLRLYRDLAQTPVTALSPTEPDNPLRPPRTSLRQEAVDMLCDLAVRKLSPGTSSESSCHQTSGTSSHSPRRLRRLATKSPNIDNQSEISERPTSTASQAETSDSDQCSVKTQITNSQVNTPDADIINPPALYDEAGKSPARPSYLNLSGPTEKPHFRFNLSSSDNQEASVSGSSNSIEEKALSVGLSVEQNDNELPSEPMSMPPILSLNNQDTSAFSYKNPAYQSANPACGTLEVAKSKVSHSSDQDIPGKVLGREDPAGSKGLLKWKGVMFAPNESSNDPKEKKEEHVGRDTTDSVFNHDVVGQDSEVFMVELTRGWNSRLGFSLQPDGNHTVISVVHPDSVASKDGRLKQGDILIMVNDESVENMSTSEIIDLLRKIRGSIGITVIRKMKRENAS
ncbi:uncharacterized protein [Prorops nasuta]|uniref:uncharacterized protein n=1 Tax=Prorops nasuta TaxID=863751 RepID=UPI0034CFC5B2